ncbi:hypothetical protein [Kaistella montana]|uniref:Uncharacterized protein n=1 Tax=Kaistella montana TaxID=1849733 RepID=A0ABW5KCC9_9FLAO|nr:hypothetical protein [Kaistella montana]MCQ4035761.1 hypothetical protein [Kaistella montana]
MYRQVLLIFFISYFGWDIAFVVYNLVDSHPEKFGDFINRFYRKLPFSNAVFIEKGKFYQIGFQY